MNLYWLANHRKRVGIILGQMAVLLDNSSWLDQVEWPRQKWTPVEKEKAFQEFRDRARIIPHKKQVAEATSSAVTPTTDTRGYVACDPKPTRNLKVTAQRNKENGARDVNSDT